MRTTASQLPITIPATTLRDYKRMTAVDVHISTGVDGIQSLEAQFAASNTAGDILPGHGFNVRIADVQDAETGVPRLTEALDNLMGILGRYYRLQHVEEELARTPSIALKYEQLRISRDAAESDVRQPVTQRSNR